MPPTIVPMNDLESGFQPHFVTMSRTYSAALRAPSGIRQKMLVVAQFVLELVVFALWALSFAGGSHLRSCCASVERNNRLVSTLPARWTYVFLETVFAARIVASIPAHLAVANSFARRRATTLAVVSALHYGVMKYGMHWST